MSTLYLILAALGGVVLGAGGFLAARFIAIWRYKRALAKQGLTPDDIMTPEQLDEMDKRWRQEDHLKTYRLNNRAMRRARKSMTRKSRSHAARVKADKAERTARRDARRLARNLKPMGK
jgi:hypothetical protein